VGWACGCSKYAKKRLLLHEHRRQMRVMEALIEEAGLAYELEERLVEETGDTGFWLGDHGKLDEGSDQEDPEAALRAAQADQRHVLQAVQGAVECQSMRRDLERARMQLEDRAAWCGRRA
jgi:hypothetical protein